jgi:hypothetical protein
MLLMSSRTSFPVDQNLSTPFLQANMLRLQCMDGTFLLPKQNVQWTGDSFGVAGGELT